MSTVVCGLQFYCKAYSCSIAVVGLFVVHCVFSFFAGTRSWFCTSTHIHITYHVVSDNGLVRLHACIGFLLDDGLSCVSIGAMFSKRLIAAGRLMIIPHPGLYLPPNLLTRHTCSNKSLGFAGKRSAFRLSPVHNTRAFFGHWRINK